MQTHALTVKVKNQDFFVIRQPKDKNNLSLISLSSAVLRLDLGWMLRARRDEDSLASRDVARLLMGTHDMGYSSNEYSTEAGKLPTLSEALHFIGSVCGKNYGYVSDDDNLGEFFCTGKDDKSELSMTDDAKDSRRKRRSAYAKLEELMNIYSLPSAARDIAAVCEIVYLFIAARAPPSKSYSFFFNSAFHRL